MSHLETREAHVETKVRPAYSQSARSNCPDCEASLVVLQVIGGRADCEYWTMRCTRCGGIHLDIVKT
jgi:uncharacterized Zn finger protein